MISENIEFVCSDSHSVIDYETKNCLNRAADSIIIGNNVWIGRNAIFNKNSSIPNNSIVGNNSIITKKFHNYSKDSGGG